MAKLLKTTKIGTAHIIKIVRAIFNLLSFETIGFHELIVAQTQKPKERYQ
jgi:hypothetical protein